MRNALIVLALTFCISKVNEQNSYNKKTIVIQGKKESVKVLAPLVKAYFLSQDIEVNIHPHSGYVEYIQMSESLLQTMTDTTSNFSTVNAKYEKCF